MTGKEPVAPSKTNTPKKRRHSKATAAVGKKGGNATEKASGKPSDLASTQAAEATAAHDIAIFGENIKKIEALSQRLITMIAQRKEIDHALSGPSLELYAKAATSYMAKIMQDPARMIGHQLAYWTRTLQNYTDSYKMAVLPKADNDSSSAPDRRFQNPMWQNNPFFKSVKQQYFLNAEAILQELDDLPAMEDADKGRARYFIKQIIDVFSPTNFLHLNPDALEKAIETQGESLILGLENLIHDIETNNGELLVTLADRKAFQLGENIATTPGVIIYRNTLFELIQYNPSSETVFQTPLVFFPPWINKYYILDLKADKSLIKWMVDQGYTVFVVSWVNPDASYAKVGMDDYIRDGYLRAIAEVRRITGEKHINTVGYCIAGTTLALTLAHLQRVGDTSVKSATFLTTLTDFSEPGEIDHFLDNDFVDGIERQSTHDGVLSKFFMGRTFSFLRPNDLIYQPAIKSYMMGEPPPAFDLLYWNGDGTNLPATMAMQYLRGLCQEDGFARGSFPVFGQAVHLKDVKPPLCAIACETDHITQWKSSFNGIKQMGSKDKTFILSESGHIAGIINPPSKNKYGHYTKEGPINGSPENWKQKATFSPTSWWPRWEKWLRQHSGAFVPARKLGGDENPVLCLAPGQYVHTT